MSSVKGTLRSTPPLPKLKLKLTVWLNCWPVGEVQAGATPVVT